MHTYIGEARITVCGVRQAFCWTARIVDRPTIFSVCVNDCVYVEVTCHLTGRDTLRPAHVSCARIPMYLVCGLALGVP